MGEKKMDAAAEELRVFTEQPELRPEEQVQADSYTESLDEQLQELKDAGIPVPEKEPGVKLDLPDTFGGIEQGFNTEPELTPEAQIEAGSYTESMEEQLQELKDAGIPVPEKEPGVKLDLPDAIGGIEQGFNTQAELTPEEQIEADGYVESMAEQLDELKTAGIPVPEKQSGHAVDLPDAFGGIQQGFNTQADLSPEMQLEADSYTESVAEQIEEIKKILDK